MRISVDKPTTKELARFLTHVQITKHCWLWVGCLNRCGYGRFIFHCKTFSAHRFSYTIFVSPIEPGKQILHRRECGNRACVNPNHLYMGTNADNVRDRILWGKGYYGNVNGNAKLSENDVIEIRRIHENKKYGYNKTAKIYGVSMPHIARIAKGQSWKHLIIQSQGDYK